MKKHNYMMMIIAAIGIAGLSGCFTSATAYTEKTAPDGTVTISKVSIKGTGDKASQVAAEGLFADGGEDDLGAGVKNANASQTSTGIDGTLKGIEGIFVAGVNAGMAMQTGGFVGTPKATATTTIDSTGSLVRVYLNGQQIDQFDPTGMTAEAIATRAGCTTGNCSPVK